MPEFGRAPVPVDDILVDGRVNAYPSVIGRDYFSLDVTAGTTRVQAGSFVGVIPINDQLTLEVSPRVPLRNMSRLLAMSGRAPRALEHALRRYESEGDLYPSLATIYASVLRGHVDYIANRGLLREYRRVEEVSSFPRGRIQIGETMRRAAARGIEHRVALTQFERTVDNAPNQCLLYAIWRLSRYAANIGASLPRKELRRIQVDLNYCKQRFQGVRLDLSEHFLRDRTVAGEQALPSLRAYYQPALELALTIIGKRAVVLERDHGELQLPSLIVNMSEVFEAYLREVLMRAAQALGAEVFDGNTGPPVGASRLLLREGATIEATPDIVTARRLSDGTCEPRVIVEVKYKPAKKLPDRPDLNQTITYGLAYGAPHVLIVQPRGEDTPIATGLHRLGRIGKIHVWYHVFDLAGDAQLEEQRFVEAVGSLAARAEHARSPEA